MDSYSGYPSLDEVKSALVKIFVDLIKLCEEHGLTYYLSGGTAIGAVRHNGFIPWDDDIDIYLLRDDYERFLSLRNSLPADSPYEIIDMQNPGYYLPFAKFCKKDSTIWEHGNIPFLMGLYVDVFPMDEFNETKENIKLASDYRKAWEAYPRSLRKHKLQHFTSKIRQGHLRPIPRMIEDILWICPREHIYRERIIEMDRAIKEIKGDYLYCYGLNRGALNKVYPKDWFAERVDISFEGLTVKIQKGYDNYLSKQFGNYMQFPPESERLSTHKRFFLELDHPRRSQEEVLAIKKELGEL